MKQIVNVALALVLFVLSGLWVYGYLPADSAQVQNLIDQAEGDDDIAKLVNDLFEEHPTPTNRQVSLVRNQIEALLVNQKTQKFIAYSGESRALDVAIPEAQPEIDTFGQMSTAGRVLVGLCGFWAFVYLMKRFRYMRDQG